MRKHGIVLFIGSLVCILRICNDMASLHVVLPLSSLSSLATGKGGVCLRWIYDPRYISVSCIHRPVPTLRDDHTEVTTLQCTKYEFRIIVIDPETEVQGKLPASRPKSQGFGFIPADTLNSQPSNPPKTLGRTFTALSASFSSP